MRRVRLCEGHIVQAEAAPARPEVFRPAFVVLSFLALSSLLAWAEVRSEMTRLHELALNAPPQRAAPTEPATVRVASTDRW